MENYYMKSYENNKEANLPPGFRFHPTDEELITYYLLKKVLDCSFTSRAIAEVDLNKCEPWHLPGIAKMGEKEWYFFSLRDRKYPTGLRTNRATEAGYWKATGKDRDIYSSKSGSLVGMKKTLVFYGGRAPKGEKSNWVMHEYRLEGKLAYHYLSRNSKDEWVISRVFQKSGAGSTSSVGAKKRPSSSSSVRDVVSSPSSVVSLPPPPSNDHHESNTNSTNMITTYAKDEHVSCFSMTQPPPPPPPPSLGGFNHMNSFFEIPPPPTLLMNHDHPSSSRFPTMHNNVGGVSAFPSLRSLQENLHLPNFLFSAPSTMHGAGGDQMSSYGGQWGATEVNHKIGTNELDCMWGY
ncbi:hypothetical protein ACJIZ3_011049 [Penstemon smallii]|uniref:NAC domain-containing protein n=1 Tax=Penstemon smallii TaxID=265156 RepID=A0ABD3UI65_9LAMI